MINMSMYKQKEAKDYTKEELIEAFEKYSKKLLSTPAEQKKVSMAETTIEILARRSHQKWCEAKTKDGYIYGPEVNDEKKITNLLVDWSCLPEAAKEANRVTARKTLDLFARRGLYPIPAEEIILQIAEEIHDEWVRHKLELGYVYGPVRNDDPTNGPLTHRDMLPFWLLLILYPEDAAYDIDTARGIVNQMMELGFVFAAA